jgi:hypothetical protein
VAESYHTQGITSPAAAEIGVMDACISERVNRRFKAAFGMVKLPCENTPVSDRIAVHY